MKAGWVARLAVRALRPVARPYLDLMGLDLDEQRLGPSLQRAVMRMPSWGAAAAAVGALALRWLAPALILGTLRRFERLSPHQADELLARLSRRPCSIVQGLVLAVRAPLLFVAEAAAK